MNEKKQRLCGPQLLGIFMGGIWAADLIWYIPQLTGCSYLVLQSRSVFWGLTSFSNALLAFSSKCFTWDAYLVLGVFLPSCYSLIMMFSVNWGTPQYYSPTKKQSRCSVLFPQCELCPAQAQRPWPKKFNEFLQLQLAIATLHITAFGWKPRSTWMICRDRTVAVL